MNHSENTDSQRMSVPPEACFRTVSSISASSCPFCGDWDRQLRIDKAALGNGEESPEIPVSLTKFRCHVARHMERLALFVIPREDLEDEELYDDDKSISSTESNVVIAALINGDVRAIEEHLATGAKINDEIGSRGTALAIAAYHGQDEIVKLLLHEGADLDAASGEYGTALDAAMSQHRNSIVKLLLAKKKKMMLDAGPDQGEKVVQDDFRDISGSSESDEEACRRELELSEALVTEHLYTVPEVEPDDLMLTACLAASRSEKGLDVAEKRGLDAIDKALLRSLRYYPRAKAAFRIYRIIEFHHFDPTSKKVSAVVESPQGERILCVRGAPLFVLKMVEEDRPIPDLVNEDYRNQIAEFTSRGFSSLGVVRKRGEGSWEILGIMPFSAHIDQHGQTGGDS